MATLSKARELREALDVPLARAQLALDACNDDIVAARVMLQQKAIPLEQRVTELEKQVARLFEMHGGVEVA